MPKNKLIRGAPHSIGNHFGKGEQLLSKTVLHLLKRPSFYLKLSLSESVKCRFSKCRFGAELEKLENYSRWGAASKNKSKKPWAFCCHAGIVGKRLMGGQNVSCDFLGGKTYHRVRPPKPSFGGLRKWDLPGLCRLPLRKTTGRIQTGGGGNVS